MRKRIYVMVAILLTIGAKVFAQAFVATSQTIQPRVVYVSDNKTTNLVFPAGIRSFDRGKRELLAQKAPEAENVLQVKIAKAGAVETNLTVITADGSLYSFIVRYEANPSALTLVMMPQAEEGGARVLFGAAAKDAATVSRTAELVAMQQPFLKSVGKRGHLMDIRLCGIYVKGEHLFFQLQVENTSNLDYDIDQLHFYIRDKKQSKRTSSQELDLTPAFVSGNISCISGLTRQTLVFAFPRFTIPDQKLLWVQLLERNGGRHLDFAVKNKMLLKVRPAAINW